MLKNIFFNIAIIISMLFLIGCNESKEFTPPELTGRVVDTTDTLSEEEKQEIENAILQFEKDTGGQFAVCIVPNMKNETVESASIKVAEAWKIGHEGKDNGIIFFMTMEEREFRIEVGYGYEGQINDGKAGEIGRLAVSHFKNKKWSKGICFIINSCNSIITGKKDISQISEESNENNATDIKNMIVFLIIFIPILIIIINRKKGNGHHHYYGGGGGCSGGSGYSGGGGSFGGGGFSGKF